MPAFFFNSDEYISGTVMANYTSGAPVRGNLTLKATIRPIRPTRVLDPQLQYKNRDQQFNRNVPGYNEYDTTGSYNRPVVEKYLNFVS